MLRRPAPSSAPLAATPPLIRVGASRAVSRAAIAALLVVGLAAVPVLAAPAPAQAAGPSWQQVLDARGSEQAKKAALADIQVALQAASTRAADAQTAADEAGAALTEAQLAVDEATGEYETVQQKAAAARADADAAQVVVGQAAALLARPGSGGLTGDLLSSGADAETVLRGLSMSTKIGENLSTLRDRAVSAENLATSLADQAAVALAERDKLADEASDALDAAVAASDTAQRDVAAVDEEKATLAAQAEALQDDRLTLEQAYASAQAKAAAEAAAAAARAAAAAPAPAPPRGGGGSRPVGPGSPGTSVPDPGTGWVAGIRSYSSYQAYGYRVHPITGEHKLHAGADFGASCGTPIYSVAAGTVTYAGVAGGYGNLIIIDHGNGISSAYGHMERSGIYVANGQSVSAGQNIAGVGTAGGSTGCHLHLEIRRGGIATDPVAFLATKGVR
ncbi:M23 family metallopeptidase [Frigoribacterium sp. VKM Ac-2530]|uniref:M23 family metallopeptidase n=1 Tax=Frigoribacterium sp. VKM Ac-2530 TaxID=2783822 RepID=UPI00188D834D|nr:M23 family metallopeptidase [Frigoribacterium sp. VKM Ac-2530]MBF4580832.1 peptidoglycan DD-metalloendopeptidase family protein [Frigoribacterium sp. VKM Ac-2530]